MKNMIHELFENFTLYENLIVSRNIFRTSQVIHRRFFLYKNKVDRLNLSKFSSVRLRITSPKVFQLYFTFRTDFLGESKRFER